VLVKLDSKVMEKPVQTSTNVRVLLAIPTLNVKTAGEVTHARASTAGWVMARLVNLETIVR